MHREMLVCFRAMKCVLLENNACLHFVLPEGLSSSFCILSSMKVQQSGKCKLWTLVSYTTHSVAMLFQSVYVRSMKLRTTLLCVVNEPMKLCKIGRELIDLCYPIAG